ncbi:hypothetical protein D3C77_583390 [compost metagenome]
MRDTDVAADRRSGPVVHGRCAVLYGGGGHAEGHAALVQVVLVDQCGVDQAVVPEQFNCVVEVHVRVSGDQYLDRDCRIGNIGPADATVALGNGDPWRR